MNCLMQQYQDMLSIYWSLHQSIYWEQKQISSTENIKCNWMEHSEPK